ncbi:MAG: putative ThiF family protein [Prokaryotic dsDNA virus sp.]|mgnify:FL=1|nr:MAG: putative ThiF family protein [Prokaryotic dsDNA virus sp.]
MNIMKKRKVLVIGVGGIGSYLTPLLHKTGLYNITMHDPDTVELKNISYQNFRHGDIGLDKVTAMRINTTCMNHATDVGLNLGKSYPILTKKQLEGFDLVVCCADNLAVRKMLYSLGFGDDAEQAWLDLRAQGRNGALISYLTDGNFSETLLNGPEGSFSCQGENFNESLNTEDLHFTHVAIAGYGAQWMQRWFNGNEVNDKIIVNI